MGGNPSTHHHKARFHSSNATMGNRYYSKMKNTSKLNLTDQYKEHSAETDKIVDALKDREREILKLKMKLYTSSN